MFRNMSCEQCGINLTGMTLGGAGRTFCCEGHRAQWFARVPASGARPDRAHVAGHPAIDLLLADIRRFDTIRLNRTDRSYPTPSSQ